ncbi:MAG: DUF4340 domain-containing protein [Gemmataceae bacterium]|nr:DUF4340 domain-containing protein [Gemmataceae bacterium]
MNLKTTLVLLVLVVAGGLLFWVGPTLPPQFGFLGRAVPTDNQGSLKVLEDDLAEGKVQRIEVTRDGRSVVLERSGKKWVLPGQWPTRDPEVEELVRQITNLRSRFAPIPVDARTDLARYGLDRPPVRVTLTTDAGKTYRLAFGEDPGETNRFTLPTYLRIAEKVGDQWQEKPEVIRLEPGLVASLSQPGERYQKRRLFPFERVPKADDPKEKVEELKADAVTMRDRGTDYTLARKDDEWRLTIPVPGQEKPAVDRPDPDRLQELLRAMPDVWAEHFVPKPENLASYHLEDPVLFDLRARLGGALAMSTQGALSALSALVMEQEDAPQIISVTRPGGEVVTLLIGDTSPRQVVRMVMEPAPPNSPFPAMQRKLIDRFRYAKLRGNEQVFEIKSDRLKDLFAGAPTLRDAKLARFKPEDVRELVIKNPTAKEIVLEKVVESDDEKKKKPDEKDRWRIKQPIAADADTKEITDLLQKLSALEARGLDVIDNGDAKKHGLDPVTSTITVTVEESKGEGSAKTTKTKKFTFNLGKHDADDHKLYVQMAGWPRINGVPDAIVKQVDRPALAYRGRGLFDWAANDLATVEIERTADKEKFVLEQGDGWKLSAPTKADVEGQKVNDLARAISRLEAVEYVTDSATPEELEKQYALGKPALTVTLTFKDKAKPSQTLLIGKERGGKGDYFARLAGDANPSIFVIPKKVRDELDRSSLAYRPLQLWQVPPADVAALSIQPQTEPAFSLVRDGGNWKITGPFDAPVNAKLAENLLNSLATLRCERYETHAAGAKELEAFGLDKPFLRLGIQERGDKEKPKEKAVLIGKAGKEPGTRYAKLADGDAVFLVNDLLTTGFDTGALALLDRNLLDLDLRAVKSIKTVSADGTMTMETKGDGWQVEAGGVKFTADNGAMASLLTTGANLRAQKFAAYGAKVDWAKFGLDKPAFTVTVSVQNPGDAGKPIEHTIALGKVADGSPGERYARVDNGPGVALLSAAATTDLSRPYVDYVQRTLLTFNAASLTSIVRKMGEQELELVKKEDGWSIAKPAEQRADEPTLEVLVKQLANLRAVRIAAYPAKDLKVYGLAEPTAVITLRLPDGKVKEHVIKIGHEVNMDKDPGTTQDRFVLVDDATAVGILPGTLVRQLLAPPILFRDRSIAKLGEVDKVVLERGPRKAVFVTEDGSWKMKEPLATAAEHDDLEEFLNGLRRLRADELVADKPDDLKPYGLDRPECRWRFLSGDKELFSLLVGAKEKSKGGEGNRAYAKLDNSDVVFLLSPVQTAKALGEYRSRALWPALDAAQVERLEFRNAENTKSFVLEKVDNTWQVKGKADLKVSEKTVNDALAALAQLKAERTVVDKDADLKLFGLEPPQLVIEARTSSGAKRVLKIGRSEGESKRAYAQVGEGTRSDVVIISEKDGARIVRDLAAFSEK